MMSQKYKRVSAADQPQSTSNTVSDEIDWDLCALCQTPLRAPLICPARKNGDGYRYVAEKLQKFHELGLLPIPVNLSLLNEGDGFENTFRMNSAQWHKSCRSKVSNTELKRKQEDKPSCGTPVKPRRTAHGNYSTLDGCFFCGENDGVLHKASTMRLNQNVRECAHDLRDRNLLAKLSAGDMVAIDAVYHNICLAKIYKRAEKSRETNNTENKNDFMLWLLQKLFLTSKAFEMTRKQHQFLACHKCANSTQNVWKNSESKNLKFILLAFGKNSMQPFQTSCLHCKGENTYSCLTKTQAMSLKKKAYTQDSEVLHIAQAAQLIRRELFKVQNSFNGTFGNGCQDNSVPFLLKAFVSMILNGPDAIEEASNRLSQHQAVLTIAQLLAFNCKKRAPKTTSSHQRHSEEKKTPLPVYIIANSVCNKFETDGVVVPASMDEGVFTAGVVDNIDHNPSSTTSSDSFHGTSISLIQHRQTDSDGNASSISVIDRTVKGRTCIARLPISYTDVLPVAQSTKELFLPPCDANLKLTIHEDQANHKTRV